MDEEAKVSAWADATRLLASEGMDENEVMLFLLSIVQENRSIPVIVTDGEDEVLFYRNISENDSLGEYELGYKLDRLKADGRRIDIMITNGEEQHLYYSDSAIISMLEYYPFVQITLVGLLIIFAYIIFSRANKYEQNLVWVGLARETAHQLGTPISALLGWRDLLLYEDDIEKCVVASEMSSDIARLQSIADRFSKIGSSPEMTLSAVVPEIEGVVEYLKMRVGKKTKFEISVAEGYTPYALHNGVLISWAIENILKNSIDAMSGNGEVRIEVKPDKHYYTVIDISDNGKGMTKGQARKIFRPGYTTKTRGWGIGMSLTKRIIEEYHKGRVYVKRTEVGVGTTIRIVLRK
ncbi:MAG: HAMP domain-containing histidine kinase [Oscillospiraceae bacterium]|nr:HAMP domain-containing histidine kinase [Oscillospiraceae bacterium]